MKKYVIFALLLSNALFYSAAYGIVRYKPRRGYVDPEGGAMSGQVRTGGIDPAPTPAHSTQPDGGGSLQPHPEQQVLVGPGSTAPQLHHVQVTEEQQLEAGLNRDWNYLTK